MWLLDLLKQRFRDRPALLSWVLRCVDEVNAERSELADAEADPFRRLAEDDAAADFREWLDAANEALDHAFFIEHPPSDSDINIGRERIKRWQKKLYPWRSPELGDHRRTFLEGNDVDFPKDDEV